MARGKNPKVKIVEVDDPEFVNLYGGAFRAVCTDGWESDLRSTHARAQASGDEHLAEITDTDDDAPAEETDAAAEETEQP